MRESQMPNALITGASAGLGRALALELAPAGWTLTIDARTPEPLERIADELAAADRRSAPCPATSPTPATGRPWWPPPTEHGPVDLLVNNASDLGGSPLPRLRDLDAAAYERLWRANVLAPQQLDPGALPRLRPGAVIVNISSDAGAEHYESWGGYGSTKAALDHQTRPGRWRSRSFTWYSMDPGRHADGDAPGRVPRRGHQRPARAGDRRAASSSTWSAPAGPAGGTGAVDLRHRSVGHGAA